MAQRIERREISDDCLFVACRCRDWESKYWVADMRRPSSRRSCSDKKDISCPPPCNSVTGRKFITGTDRPDRKEQHIETQSHSLRRVFRSGNINLERRLRSGTQDTLFFSRLHPSLRCSAKQKKTDRKKRNKKWDSWPTAGSCETQDGGRRR